MAKQVMLFDSHNMVFKIFRLEVANKKPFSTKSKFFHGKEKQFFWDTKIFPTSENILKEQEKFNFAGKDLVN